MDEIEHDIVNYQDHSCLLSVAARRSHGEAKRAAISHEWEMQSRHSARATLIATDIAIEHLSVTSQKHFSKNSRLHRYCQKVLEKMNEY